MQNNRIKIVTNIFDLDSAGPGLASKYEVLAINNANTQPRVSRWATWVIGDRDNSIRLFLLHIVLS